MISILLSVIIVALVIFIFIQSNKSSTNIKNGDFSNSNKSVISKNSGNSGNLGNLGNLGNPGNSISKNSDSKLTDLDTLYTNLTNAKTSAFYASTTIDNIIEAKNAGIPIDENDVLTFRKYMTEAIRLVNLSNDQISKMRTASIERFTSAEENNMLSDLKIYNLQLKSITDTIDQIMTIIKKSRLDGKLYPIQALPVSTFDQNSLIVKIANSIRNPVSNSIIKTNPVIISSPETIKNVNSKIQTVIETKLVPLPRLDIEYITTRVSKIETGASECNKYASYMTTQFMPLADLYLKNLNISGMRELDDIMKTTASAYPDLVDSMISLQNDIVKYVGDYIDPQIDQYMNRIKQLVELCKSMEIELFDIYKNKYITISALCYSTHKQNAINTATGIYQSVLSYYNVIDKMLNECSIFNQSADTLSHGTDVQSIQTILEKIMKILGTATDTYTKMIESEKLLKPLVDSYDEVNIIIYDTSAMIDKIPKYLTDMGLYLDSVKVSLSEAFDNLNIQIIKDTNQIVNQTELDMENSSAQFDTATMSIVNIRNLNGQIYNLDSMNQYYSILVTCYNVMKDNLNIMVNRYKTMSQIASNDDSKTLVSNSKKYLDSAKTQVDTVSGYITEGSGLIESIRTLRSEMLNNLAIIIQKISKIQTYREQLKSTINQVEGYHSIIHEMMAYPEKQSAQNWADSIKYADLVDQARIIILSIVKNINIEDNSVLDLLATNQLVEAQTQKKALDDAMTNINTILDLFENLSVEIHSLVEDVKQIRQLLEIIPKLLSIVSDVDQVRQSSITLRNQSNTAYSTYDWNSISSTPTSTMMKQLDGYKDSVDLQYQNMVNIGTRQNAYIQNLLNIGKANVNFIDVSIASLEDDLTQIDRLYVQASLIIDQESDYSTIIIDVSKKVQSTADLAIERIYQLNDLIELATSAARKKLPIYTYELQANDLANLIKGAYSFNLDSYSQAKGVINSYIRPIPTNVKTAYNSITNNMDIMKALIEYTDDLQTNWIQINKLVNS